jgi:hypothetical protein
MQELFQHERNMTSLEMRIMFYDRYAELERMLPWSLPDAARMAGLLIRWLEDLVESPPRRPGATPEENADLALFGMTALAMNLSPVADEAGPLYDSLPRPAQSAWTRLLTTHLPHLPPFTRMILYINCKKVGNREDVELRVWRESVADVLATIARGDMIVDAGRGLRRCLLLECFTILEGRLLRNKYLPPGLFDDDPSNVLPRRLALMMYQDMLAGYDPRRRTFDPHPGTSVRFREGRAGAAPCIYK